MTMFSGFSDMDIVRHYVALSARAGRDAEHASAQLRESYLALQRGWWSLAVSAESALNDDQKHSVLRDVTAPPKR
jgi:hypothetical protein